MSRVALVTGAAGGIGRALVEAFADGGYAVVGVDCAPGPGPQRCTRFVSCDLADPQAPERLVRSISGLEGRLDLIINNAALQFVKPVVETALADWDRLMAINLRAPFLLARDALHLLEVHGGAIVNIASIHALATSPGLASYAASKGGLVALTRALALEFAGHHVRVNAILPGAVDTPMLKAGLRRAMPSNETDIAEKKLDLAKRTPAGRLGAPEEIAQVAVFLADPGRAGFITGQVFVVDGGALARLSTE